jgi:putative transposase
VTFPVVYLLVRCLLGCLIMLAQGGCPRDAELTVLGHENTLLRRQIGRVRYQPADRLWLAALSQLNPPPPVGPVVRGDPSDAARLAPATGHT